MKNKNELEKLKQENNKLKKELEYLFNYLGKLNAIYEETCNYDDYDAEKEYVKNTIEKLKNRYWQSRKKCYNKNVNLINKKNKKESANEKRKRHFHT